MAKILLVDDETDFRQEMTALLQDWGFEALPASSGAMAIDLAKAERPEIAIVDLILPGAMNGYSIISKLHAALPETIIFAITAYFNANLEARVSNAGANKFYKKPLNIEQLKTDITQIVGIPTPPKESVKKEEPKIELEKPQVSTQMEIISLFKYLQKPDYKKIMHLGRTINLEKGKEYTAIIPQHVVMVHSGQISVRSEKIHTHIRNAGSTFGCAFIMAKELPASDIIIKANEASKVTIIEAVHLRNFFKLNPRYTSAFLLELCKTLSQEIISGYDLQGMIRIE